LSVDTIKDGLVVMTVGGQREIQLYEMGKEAILLKTLPMTSDNVSCVKTVSHQDYLVTVFATLNGRFNYLM
jgi:hypothetical protein